MPERIFTNLMALSLATLFAGLMVGCGNKPVADKTDDAPQADSIQSSESLPPKPDLATLPTTLPESDATASEVCERFVSLLQQGERTLAEQLLTRKALKTTVDVGLELQTMGGVDSQATVATASYATSRAKVAQVPCTILEKDGSKQELTWMMRRGESGWRIAGLIVQTQKAPEFLSLENKADVSAIMRANQGEVVTTDVRQVSATDDE